MFTFIKAKHGKMILIAMVTFNKLRMRNKLDSLDYFYKSRMRNYFDINSYNSFIT